MSHILTTFNQVRGLQVEVTGLVQSPGPCTDCSGAGVNVTTLLSLPLCLPGGRGNTGK